MRSSPPPPGRTRLTDWQSRSGVSLHLRCSAVPPFRRARVLPSLHVKAALSVMMFALQGRITAWQSHCCAHASVLYARLFCVPEGAWVPRRSARTLTAWRKTDPDHASPMRENPLHGMCMLSDAFAGCAACAAWCVRASARRA